MVKFLLGFLIGVGVGGGLALLLAPNPGQVNRERLRLYTDRYAAGEETPVGTVTSKVYEQRNRLEQAIDAGRQASAARQAELWAQLKLAPTDKTPPEATV